MTQERREKSLIRRFYINQRYQLKYTLMVAVITTFITALWGWLYYANESEKTELLQIQNPELAALVTTSDQSVLLYLLAFFVFQFLIILFFGIYYTHRVAGPVYRLQKYFDTVEKTGELAVFERVRERDEFQQMYETLSRAVERLRSKDAVTRQSLKLVEDHLEKNRILEARQELRKLSEISVPKT